MKHTILTIGTRVTVDLGDEVLIAYYTGHDPCAVRLRLQEQDVVIPWHNIKRITAC